jgi:radical SAM superfamily enzyme YgiQ (UPF0313 family)
MKVLLINPWDPQECPPPSTGYLQAALKHQGIDVVAKDLKESLLDTEQYDIVGVSFHSFSVKYARQIRDKFKGHLICGGHHPSAMWDQMFKIGYDQVVVGEGENAIIGIVQGDKNKLVYSDDHKFFNHVNDLPFPDYTGLNYSGILGIPIITSRGCPNQCSFCASTDFWHHKYKMRSAENVLMEVEQRKAEGYKTWIFYDDNFTAHRKRVIDICSGLDGRLIWRTVSRAEDLDSDLCHEMYRAGCRDVYLGIESMSQDALDRCKKGTTVEKMIKGIQAAEQAKIRTFCLFIVGLPGDTIKDVEETSRNRRRVRMSRVGVNIAWIVPGTELYRKAKEKGFDDEVFLTSGAPFYTYEQNMNTLQKWSRMI